MNKIEKFYELKNMMQCPVCGKKIRFHAGGYVCKREHRYDISAKGYVNFLGNTKNLKGYDAKFFESRKLFFEHGFYDHIAESIEDVIDSRQEIKSVVDAGCGEGFYARRISAKYPNLHIVSFDIASEAIKIAARGDSPVGWVIADITKIPVKDGAADCILDIFTPANYNEFNRILGEEGVLIKVVPGENHLKEIREAAKSVLRNETYSNEEVLDYYSKHFNMVERRRVSATRPINQQQMGLLTAMTPLLFDVDISSIDLSEINEITVDAEILVGTKK